MATTNFENANLRLLIEDTDGIVTVASLQQTDLAQPSGGGAYLSANTARVDPNGNDSTGTVGDLTKPFLTVQSALNHIIANVVGGTVNGVIQLSAVNFTEDLSIDITGITAAYISIIGLRGHGSGDYELFNSLTVVGGSTLELYLERGNLGGGDINFGSGSTFLYSHNVDFNGAAIVHTGVGTCSVVSRSNSSGGVSSITANSSSNIIVSGLWSYGDTLISSTAANAILLGGCPRLEIPENSIFVISKFNITAANSTVIAIQSTIGDLTCSSVTLIDARIVGTNNAGSTTYSDIWLNPALMDFSTLPQATSEPAIAVGAAWIDTTTGLNIVKVKLA